LLFLVLWQGLALTLSAQDGSGIALSGRVSGQDDKGTYVGVLPNAKVELFKSDKSAAGSASADETGFYQITGLKAGTYTYKVSANGYAADEAGRGMAIPEGGEGVVFDFMLSTNQPVIVSPGILSGNAWGEKDGKRTPMAGVQVTAKLESGGHGLVNGYTDAKGAYTLTLTPGSWKTSASSFGMKTLVYPEVVTIKETSPATADFIFAAENQGLAPLGGKVFALASVPAGSATAGVVPVIRFVNRENGKVTNGTVTSVSGDQLTAAGLPKDALSGAISWFQAEPSEALTAGRYLVQGDHSSFATVISPEKQVSPDLTCWFDIAFVPERKPVGPDMTDVTKPVRPVQPEIPGEPVVPGLRGRVSGQSEVGEYLGVVPGATVAVLDGSGTVVAQTTSNETGYYELTGLGAGNWTYRVTAPNFAPDDAGRGFSLEAGTGVQVYDFILSQKVPERPSLGVVYGTVVRGEGRNSVPLAGSMISLRPAAGGTIRTVMTDQSGSYRLELPATDWQVSALSSEFEASVYPAVVSLKAGGEEAADFNFQDRNRPDVPTMNDVFVLTSVEKDREGRGPVPVVEFVSDDGRVRIPAVVSPIEGAALAGMGVSAGARSWDWYGAKPSQPLPSGRYRAQGQAAGCTPASTETKTLGQSLSVVFDLALSRVRIEPPVVIVNPPMPVPPIPVPSVPPVGVKPGELFGRVNQKSDKGRRPIANTRIIAVNDAGVRLETVTNDEGLYSLKLPVDNWRVTATGPTGDSVHPDVISIAAESKREVDFSFAATPPPMPDPVVVQILVTCNKGEVIPGAKVRLVRKAPGADFERSPELTTDEKGGASRTLEEGFGTYTVVAGLEGYKPYSGDVVVNESNRSLTIQLIELPELLITVSDSAGKVLPGADLRLIDKTRGKSLSEAVQSLTDEEGVGPFILQEGPGDYVLMASLSGYQPLTRELKVEEESTEISISLFREGEMRPMDLTGVLVELTPGQDKAYRDGKRVPNALIAFQASEGAALPESLSSPLRTNAKGEFSAKGVLEGNYLVSIAAEGYLESTASLQVVTGMEEALLSLNPRNTEKEDWIRKILTDGWGNTPRSREFHENGVRADSTDSNVDYALGLSMLTAKEKDTAIAAYSQAVGKVSGEMWWDRASEGHIWTLMFHEQAETAAAEIRRLVSSQYRNRAANEAGHQTAYLFGVAVGVLNGPWGTEATRPGYAQLDQEVSSSLQEPLLTSYLEGRKRVTDAYSQMTEAEGKAKKEKEEAAAAEQMSMVAAAQKKLQDLQTQLNNNTAQQESMTGEFTTYRTNVESTVTGYGRQLQDLEAQIQQLQSMVQKESQEMDATAGRKMQELEGGLKANAEQQERQNQQFLTYRNQVEAAANGYTAQLQDIQAQLQQIQTAMNDGAAQAAAAEKTRMAAQSGQRMQEIQTEMNNITTAQQALNQQFTTYRAGVEETINGYSAQKQQLQMQMQEIQAALNQWNALPGFCEVCLQSAEKQPDCPDCAEVRRQKEANIITLSQQLNPYQTQMQQIDGLIATAQGQYREAEGQYQQQVNQMNTSAATLTQEYNQLGQQMNANPKTEGEGMNEQVAAMNRQATQLQAQYQEIQGMLTALQKQYQDDEAKHLQFIKEMTESANVMTADYNRLGTQMANPGGQKPPGEGPMSAANTQLLQLQNQYQEVQGLITKTQEDYRIAGEKHEKQFNELTRLSVTLTNQINELNAQIAAAPVSNEKPAGEGTESARPKAPFASFADYPIEQRRQELLGWVTRESKLPSPVMTR